MSKSQVGPAALLIALIAAALALMLLPGAFAWLAGIGGLVLVFILLAYDGEGYRSVFESLAFAAVFAFCLMLAASVILRAIAVNQVGTQGSETLLGHEWLPLLWLAITVIFWPIDRARMSGRAAPVDFARATLLGSGPAPSAIPVMAMQPVPVSATALAATPPPPQPPPAPPARQPIWQPASAPSVVPSQPTPRPAPVATPEPRPVPPVPPPPPPVTPAPAVPPPNAVPVPAGKRTMIYVTLEGEGLNMLRSVEAEHMGRDFYRIIEPMPENETWEYKPGQVVRCRKQNLSSGKALVAFEEAPRAQ